MANDFTNPVCSTNPNDRRTPAFILRTVKMEVDTNKQIPFQMTILNVGIIITLLSRQFIG